MRRDALQSESTSADPVQQRDSTIKLLLVVLIAAVLVGLLFMRVNGINGTQHFIWFYRRVDAWRVYLPMFLAALPCLVALWTVLGRSDIRFKQIAVAIACIMFSNFAMQLVMVAAPSEPYSFHRVVEIISNEDATSYFIDAARVDAQMPLGRWLDEYDLHLPHLTFHSKEKPPGPILYHLFWIKLFGPTGAAALFGGIVIGLLSTLSIPMTYWLIARLTGDRRAALAGAGYFALSPCLIHFFPMFDQIYPIFACAMIGLWVLALRDNRPWLAAAFGAAMSLAIFFSYAHLVLGAFIVLYSVVHMIHHGREGVRRFLLHAAIGLGVVGFIYLVFWLATGFDPIAAFLVAFRNQQELLSGRVQGRDWPGTIFPDLQDFLLGSGWISLLLLIFWLIRRRAESAETGSIGWPIVWIGLTQIVIVSLTGLLPGETARVWIFLQPLMMLPIGLELARWDKWQRNVLYLALLGITCAQGHHLAFIRGHGITQTLILTSAAHPTSFAW